MITVAGSDANDIITISKSGVSLVVNVQPGNTNQSFPIGDVTGIIVNAESGSDFFTMDDALAINASVAGGAGKSPSQANDESDRQDNEQESAVGESGRRGGHVENLQRRRPSRKRTRARRRLAPA